MNSLTRPRLLTAAVLGILAAGSVASQSVLAAEVEESISIPPERVPGSGETRVTSRMAVSILRHIADARAAIHKKNPELARKELQVARSKIDTLRAELPTAIVSDQIKIAKQHLDYEEAEEVVSDLVPIETSLTELEALVPVETTKTHLQNARRFLQGGDKAAGKKALEAIEDTLIYSEADLPLSSTEGLVIAAQRALEAKQPEKADQALKKAESGVEFLSTVMVSPVVQARNSLWQATRDLATKHYKAARKDLARAGAWLDMAAKSTDKLTRDEAKRLGAALDKLKKQTELKGKKVAASVKGLLERSKALVERQANKIAIGWKGKRPDADIRADLIDAKQHVAFAENMQFYAESDPADIFDALNKAKGELDKVLGSPQLNDTEKSKLSQIMKDLASIRDNPAQQGLYDSIRISLRKLIHGIGKTGK